MFELSRNVHELESLRLHKDLRVNCEGSGGPPFQCKCCSITYVIKDILIGEDVQFDHDINNNEDANSIQKDLEGFMRSVISLKTIYQNPGGGNQSQCHIIANMLIYEGKRMFDIRTTWRVWNRSRKKSAA